MDLWERERILGKKCGQLRRNGWSLVVNGGEEDGDEAKRGLVV